MIIFTLEGHKKKIVYFEHDVIQPSILFFYYMYIIVYYDSYSCHSVVAVFLLITIVY